jgi:enolase
MATCRAGAAAKNVPLYHHIAELAGKPTDTFVTPVPALNIINGGQHAGNGLEMQEFMILPTGADGFKDSMRMGVEVYHSLKSLLIKMFGKSSSLIGDEGGFGAP